ncbi:MAG TPA: methyl-accepting chemotaxis protein, partial [Tissierellaceae bacterium]
IIVMLVVMLAITGVYMANSTNKLLEANEIQRLNSLSDYIKEDIDKELEIARLSAINIANSREVKEAFAKRDREELLSLTLETYKKVNNKFSQAQFHLPDSTSFLRLHMPEKYGDDLSAFRNTVNLANKTKKEVSGLEEGVAGFGMRVVLPIEYEGKHLGTFEYGSDIEKVFIDDLKELYGGEFYIYKFNEDNKSELVSLTADEDLFLIEDEEDLEKILSNEVLIKRTKDKKDNILLVPLRLYSGQVGGYLKYTEDRDVVVNYNKNVLKGMSIFILIVAVVIFIIFYILIGRLMNPLGNLIEKANKVAEGDFTQKIEVRAKDEIGLLAASFNNISENLSSMLKKINDSSAQVAATSQELSATSEEVSASTEEISSNIQGVSEMASNQLETVQQSREDVHKMAELINNLNTNVIEINKSVDNTKISSIDGLKSSKEAEETILDVKKSTLKTTDDINRLNENSEKIGAIIETIGNIAEQTNLLALNAAIEAARVGDAGRGFSVVAEEVRKLAEESKNSTIEISDLIKQIQEDVSLAVESMSESNEKINKSVVVVNESNEKFIGIEDEVSQVANQMKDVNDVVEKIYTGAEGILEIFEDITNKSHSTLENSESVTAASEEQTAAISEIANAATELASLASDLQVQTSRFKY